MMAMSGCFREDASNAVRRLRFWELLNLFPYPQWPALACVCIFNVHIIWCINIEKNSRPTWSRLFTKMTRASFVFIDKLSWAFVCVRSCLSICQALQSIRPNCSSHLMSTKKRDALWISAAPTKQVCCVLTDKQSWASVCVRSCLSIFQALLSICPHLQAWFAFTDKQSWAFVCVRSCLSIFQALQSIYPNLTS